MPTQEELNAAQVELDIANDNYAQMANKYNQFQDVFKLYADATPEMQAKAKNAMVRALDEFENLKLNMYAAEDRIQQAQNRVNSYNEIIANQPVQTVTQWGQRRRQISTVNNPDWQFIQVEPVWGVSTVLEEIPTQEVKEVTIGETPNLIKINPANNIVTPTTNYVPSQSMINAQTWLPWTLTAWKWLTAWEYLWNVWQWVKENINPTTWVYQNNSRQPWYNLWRMIWNAVIPVTAALWATSLAWTSPTTTTSIPKFVSPKYTGTPNPTTSIPKFTNTLKYSPTRAMTNSNLQANRFVNALL